MRGHATQKGGKESGRGKALPIDGGEPVPRTTPASESSPVPRNHLVVGVSGPIGSGKSTLCAALVEKGAKCVSGDRVGHEVLEADRSVRQRLVEVFGAGIVDGEGRIDRGVLGRRAFRSSAAVRSLNQIVHPSLVARLRERIAAHRRKGKGVLVIDAALIPEWEMEPELDVVVHVAAPAADRMARWCEATGRSREDFEQRERGQLPERQKRRNALVVVHNDGSEQEFHRKAEILWDLLKNIEAGKTCLTKRVEL